MPNIGGYIPIRIIADILASFLSFFRTGGGATWAWPTTALSANLTDVREGADSAGTFRTIRPIFNSTTNGSDGILDQDAPSEITPRLTRDDFTELELQEYNQGGNYWGVVAHWGQSEHSSASTVVPTVRITSSDGMTERIGSAEIQAGDVLQIRVPNDISDTPGAGTLPDNALRIKVTINQD